MTDSDSALSITDRYEIITLLGQGGTSLVYKARDKVLDRIVAIKTLTVKILSEKQYVQFQQEARALSNLKHGCIMEILDFGMTKSGKPYMVLEFVEGTSLSRHIETLGPLPVEIALPIFSDLCQALAHAHAKHILHRDIKPSNIILAPSGKGYFPKIIDFGLAILDEAPAAKGGSGEMSVAGSPPYMSPEQIANQELDKRSDLYSLGCTLYEALTGVVPYSGASAFETMNMHVSAPIPEIPILIQNENLQAYLQGIINRLLAKEKEHRFQSVESLQSEIDDLQTRIIELTSMRKKLERQTAAEAIGAQSTTTLEQKPKKYFKYLGLSSLAICIIIFGLVYFYETRHGAFQEKDQSSESDDLTKASQVAHQMEKEAEDMERDAAKPAAKNITQSLTRTISKNYKVIVARNTATVRAPAPDFNKMPASETTIDISTTELSKSNLAQLAKLPNLKMLNLSNSNLQPEQLKQIAAIKGLEKLNLRLNPAMGRANFDDLKSLKKLISLSVEGCFLPFGALKQITGLSGLEEVNFEYNTALNKEIIDRLAAMPKFKRLFLGNTIADKKLLRYLVKIKKLEVLWLERTKLDDDDFAYLTANLPNLEKICVSYTYITMKSVRASMHLPKMKKVVCIACSNMNDEDSEESIELYNRTQNKVHFFTEPYSMENYN